METTKKAYTAPVIEKILLDNEISLTLESIIPPEGPGEGASLQAPEYFNNDPFKNNIG